ncbi:hypothetical protein [Solidesulfovibrio sp.]|jgi:hypothetical protein|uniref:hypothetical protein n=1 Tax=Solidesulfovibrio sp. TaxID=2910990 RepID=UPI002B1EB7BF|nr:hypothetical protein [Solidesulfovibrio sp.]MEA5087956.1 hypothetical protein [Solidesulfovibrio sp.]
MVGNEYADDLKQELLTEMADNFFSRRHRLDERLEAFAGTREKVARQGLLALARWRAFRKLLLDSAQADLFLSGLGYDVARLSACEDPNAVTPHIRTAMGLTAYGRYRRTVRNAYEDLRRELELYNEGSFIPDPRDPRRKARVPGFNHLMETAKALNKEIESVNSCQCPSDMLRFTRSLDPERQEQEHACGGIGDACRLNEELAYACLDLSCLDVPVLPTPPELDNVSDTLDALTDVLFQVDPAGVKAAMAAK